jgi:amino acid adenylation domain-containing protein
MTSFVEVLRKRAHEVPERVAYTFLVDGEAEEVKLTYGELDQQARSIAVRLETQRLYGRRVLLLYPPGLEYIAAFWGCLYAGVVAVPAYPPRMNRNLERLQAIVADSEAAGILTTASTLARMEPLLAETPGIEKVCRVTTDDVPLDLAAGWRAPEINRESLAFLQYTSGSTAIPKGVMVTHGNLLHNEALIQRAFRQTQDSITVGWLPLYHDMGLIGTVLQPVFAGAPCILLSHVAFLQRPMRWLEAISRYRATTSGAPNFAYDLCTRKATAEERETLDLSSWTTAFNGSEPVRARTLENFATAFESCGFRPTAFFPCYGLAEATLFVSGGFKSDSSVGKSFAAKALEQNSVVKAEVNDNETRTLVACGSSCDEQQIVIVDPETGVPSAPGTVGEIWVAGESITSGYWKRPEETKLTFGARVVGNEDVSFLRTGDLGFLHEGELYVTSRLKDLIIIRGRNLYPQDIEKTVQESHLQLRPGGCAVFSADVNGEERLIVVQEAERGALLSEEVVNAIRQAVAEEHEVQPYAISIVKAGSVPKTSSGKVQRRASRKLFLSNSFETLAEWRESGTVQSSSPAASVVQSPRSVEEIEQWLRIQLAARMGVEASTIDLQKPITHYGIDSLSTIELMHNIETSLGVVIPFTNFYRSPSIGEVAGEAERQLSDRGTGSQVEISAGEVGPSLYPLSPGQQAMWFLYRLEPENAAYNVPVTVRWRNEINVTALRSAFQILVDRHAALRTTFCLHDGAVVQQVHEHNPVSFEEEDASGWEEASLEQRLSEQAWCPFKLEEGPLFRIYLMKRAPDDFLMQVVAHHIVSDLWSLTILLGELDLVYAALKNGATRDTVAAVLPQLESEYTDYVREQARVLEGEEGVRLWSFWQKNLAGQLPALNLLTDRPRAAKNRNRGKIHAFNLNAELTRKLDQLGRRSGTTLYMTFLAAYAVLLSRYTGQTEIVIGSPTAGRTRAAYTKVVGYFVNLLPFRLNLEGNPRFVELLERTRTTTLDAFSHQEYPFPLIVQRLQPNRDASRTPLFQTTFVMQQTPMLAGQELAPFALGAGGAQLKLGELTLESFPLAERVTQFELNLAVASDGACLRALLEYNTELFDSTTIESMAQHLTELLTSITTDPEQRIALLPLLTRTEEKKLLDEWNETERPYPVAGSMMSLFQAQAQQTPGAIALSCGTEQISYRELDERANRLAHYLRERGVGVEQVVGVLSQRTPELIVTLLAILKSGAAYLPLDPAYPAPRLQLMLEGSGASLLITTEALARLVQDVETPLLCLDVERARIASRPVQALADVKLDAENLAYLIYTSGSTGHPKPVGITHRSALTFMHWARDVFSAEELSGMLASTSVCFDLSVFELFAPLSWGGEVILVNNVLELATMARRERVQMINGVPPAMAELVRLGAVPEGVLTVNVGGEVLSRTLVQNIYEQTQVKRLLNLYGPSEDTTCSTWSEVARGTTPTIGRPIANTQAYILDREMRPAPVGVAGELYVGGDGLARGYLRRPEQTAEKFVPHPFSREGGERLYRTGDLSRWLASGEIEFLGRLDNQVKLRGFRIELGEIEAMLRSHGAVREAVAIVSDNRLVAYVVAEGDGVTGNELRPYLKERLPAYMMPAVFMLIEELPLTATGKVDRRRLPEPDGVRPELAERYVAPATEVEETVAGIWAETLGLERAGVNDNFFDLGGNSLLLSQMQSKLSVALKREIPLIELFNYPTVGSLARYLSTGEQQEITDEFSRAKAQKLKDETKQEPIAIIGMAGRFPGAKSVAELWQNLRAGIESVKFFSDEELAAAGVKPGVFNRPQYVRAKPVLDEMDLFDASFFGINPREAEIMDPQHRVFLECASDALENAGYDSDRYRGKIGVYAGSSMSSYMFNVLASLNGLESVGILQQLGIGNGPWSLPTRASYKLNLKGPSVSVQTACSTSLAVVHMARRSLLDGECDIALAGGVSINPRNEGYLYEEGGIVSPTGHCRAFDAKAKGTIVGDGVGLVVLKRLSEAIADGDTIYAVLLGSAMNNDGSVKIGFTAPSVEGQSEVIRAAQASAGVTADSISYVEAHGTATPLGDPIEVQALTKAFRASTDKKGFCGLGSIKTNIGHLDTAAGIAGLIKTVLALKHKQLPPSLHFEEPNPQIDFVNSPFYVNNTLKEWKVNGLPRRAGVSSFGLGGTNVHVVVEEPPELLADPDPGRPWNLLVLSARTEQALAAAGVNLKEHLQQRSDLNMSDVAYTYQIGRKTFRERQAIVCSDLQDCLQVLETGDRRRILRETPSDDQAPFLVFMFPGQGSQHVNMAAELYRTEQAFKEVVDQCCGYLEPELGFDLRSLLFADETRVAEITVKLNQTSATQPALFVIEYALARLWMEWGIRPEAMIGHSIGEYVAACLAGVFSLEDALTLVAARGKLIGDLPGGAMLAIPFSRAEARAFLGSEVSLAASNSPAMSVVSGPIEAIERLEKQLTEQDLICHRLHTSHAFHSAMVEPVLETFADLVARANPQPPQTSLISNLTGTWMESSDATDPQYWSKHLRHTVRFARGLQTLSENRQLVLLEVGPGQNLSGLAAGQLDREKCSVVSSLPHPRKPRSEVASMLEALGRLWILGVSVDWQGFNSRQRRRRVPLPTYPFERQRYWIETQPVASQPQQQTTKRPEVSEQEWRPAATSYPRPALHEPYVAPTTDLQRKIAEVWQRVLAIEEIGINDNFFELGGNSLVATQLVMEMRETFSTSVPLRDFFETPTIAAVSAGLETAEVVKEVPKIKPIPRDSLRRKALSAGSKARLV